MNRLQSPYSAAHDDRQLMLAVFRVNSALGRYVMRFVDADTGRGDEVSADDEHVLADLVTSVAEDIRARAVRRENEAAGAVPATKTRHGQEVHRPRPPVVPPTPEPLDDTLRTLDEDAVKRWPLLGQLAGLVGPPWQVRAISSGAVACARTHDWYTEAVWVIDESHVGLNRTPFLSGPRRRAVSRLDVLGSFDEVIEALQQPVRWGDEP